MTVTNYATFSDWLKDLVLIFNRAKSNPVASCKRDFFRSLAS